MRSPGPGSRINWKAWLGFGSLLLNLFLIAFIAGRSFALIPGFGPPVPGFGPPPPFGLAGPPPPPPFIGPTMILSPDELKAAQAVARERFAQIEALRRQFAVRLETAPVSADDILGHFAEVDTVMEELKRNLHRKVAEKVIAMTPAEREQFARQLVRDRH